MSSSFFKLSIPLELSLVDVKQGFCAHFDLWRVSITDKGPLQVQVRVLLCQIYLWFPQCAYGERPWNLFQHEQQFGSVLLILLILIKNEVTTPT